MTHNNELRNYEVTTITVDSDKPFTPEEAEVMDHLVKAMNKFVALPGNTTKTALPFIAAIQSCQQVICMRTIHKLFPDYFINGD